MNKNILLVGLGNFNPKYYGTRHNVGQAFCEFWRKNKKLSIMETNSSFFATQTLESGSIGLLQLKTLMNNSGISLSKALKEINFQPDQIMICVDDANLTIGQVKFRPKIPKNFHNGLKNISKLFPKTKFWTWNFGINRELPLADWVLKKFTDLDQQKLNYLFLMNQNYIIEAWKNVSESDQYNEKKAIETMINYQKKDNKPEFLTITGGQFGDEGKGKIADFLAQKKKYEIICRFSGGSNAGHTIWVGEKKYKFSMLPTAALYPEKTIVLGSGCLINLKILHQEWSEIQKLKNQPKLIISPKAHLIMPYHLLWDAYEEATKTTKIGTTKQGIGPCMQDKVARTGFMLGELLNPVIFRSKLEKILKNKNLIWVKAYQQKPFDLDQIIEHLLKYFKPFADKLIYLQDFVKKNLTKSFLFEGAQGTLLDLHFGFYPFVTSTPTSSLAAQLGFEHGGSKYLWRHLGVFKAYTTRVGTGPLFGEIPTDILAKTSNFDHEFGSVTNRKRRIAWFDIPAARYAIAVNDYAELALTCLDVFTGYNQIKIITHYQIDKKLYFSPVFDANLWSKLIPVTETLPGWSESITEIQNFNELPNAAQNYIIKLEKFLARPIKLISVGPKRHQTIVR